MRMKTTMRMTRMITAVSALWYFFRRTEAAVGGQAILPDAGRRDGEQHRRRHPRCINFFRRAAPPLLCSQGQHRIVVRLLGVALGELAGALAVSTSAGRGVRLSRRRGGIG
jgi:hypothetical protein